ncbi:M20 family metallopeptidase [Thalassobaculum salexigens]|uniref:M20 family metallopeptidase n=1 Tax=Thalassobaculum salexigens TaxID=455360 RepID=UPI0003F855ED|nr:M20 family metallopeptidase [Thalassobaculum salexigens]
MSTAATRDNEPAIDQEEIIDGILDWVEMETPTYDAARVNKLADKIQTQWEGTGCSVERVPGKDGFGDHLIVRTPDWTEDVPSILVLSHMDTVHPVGTKDDSNRIRREGDSLYGPGIYDMKAGAFLPYYAYRHLRRMGAGTALPVSFLFVAEEEVGSPTSRAVIEAEAKKAKYVLVTEPARDGGKLVTARKGVGRFEMTITGRPAHSGAKHEDGRSAVKELAHHILEIEGLTDYDRGVTTNVGLVSAGTGVNVVPRVATAEIDLRVVNAADGEEITAKILDRKPRDPDVTIEITGGMNRPPYELNDANWSLFELAREVVAESGLVLESTALTGGGSDGNFTSALGVPTLDGLGADGEGAHTLNEQVYISSLVPRAKMWVRLLEGLT